jgi:hypothetical protein
VHLLSLWRSAYEGWVLKLGHTISLAMLRALLPPAWQHARVGFSIDPMQSRRTIRLVIFAINSLLRLLATLQALRAESLGTWSPDRRFQYMRPTPQQCRDHSEHCRKMAAGAPPSLAREFESLAANWARLADDLERAQAFRPDFSPNIIPMERAER